MAACPDYDDDGVYPSDADCTTYDQHFCNGDEGMDSGNMAFAEGMPVKHGWVYGCLHGWVCSWVN